MYNSAKITDQHNFNLNHTKNIMGGVMLKTDVDFPVFFYLSCLSLNARMFQSVVDPLHQ